jgi:hypothetical protein
MRGGEGVPRTKSVLWPLYGSEIGSDMDLVCVGNVRCEPVLRLVSWSTAEKCFGSE